MGKIETGNDTRMHEGSLELFGCCMQLNKAALLNLHSVGILDDESAGRIGRAIVQAIAEHDCPASATSLDYLDFEARMAKFIGPEASLLHLGRSRQDLLSTYNRQILRCRVLEVMHQLAIARGRLLELAQKHAQTIVPMYTHGVPAQPITYGHYLLAFAEAFEGAHERLAQSYSRVNRSPLGVAVASTSTYPGDRQYLASLLGFDNVVENSFGANHVASVDAIQDALSPLSILALHVGILVQDMTLLQATSRPWLSIAEGQYSGVSSIMPQKRNPRVLEYLREMASEILAGAHMGAIISHNCTTGLTDSRESMSKLPLSTAVEMVEMLATVFDSVVIDEKQACYEASHDYSTATDLADVLFQSKRVPFRVGHGFVSKLVDYGRSQGLGLTEISFDKAKEIYKSSTGSEFPLNERQLFESVSPAHLVQARKGLGGPQISEMDRMMVARTKKLNTDEQALERWIRALESSENKLNKDFASLL